MEFCCLKRGMRKLNKDVFIVVILLIVFSISAAALNFNGFFEKIFNKETEIPKIISSELFPVKITPGQVLLVRVIVEGNNIKDVSADINHENGYDTITLIMVAKDNNQRTYEGSWISHDIKNQEWYDVIVSLSDKNNNIISTQLQYQDPTQSHSWGEITNIPDYITDGDDVLIPSGTAVENDVRQGRTFYSQGSGTQKTGNLLNSNICSRAGIGGTNACYTYGSGSASDVCSGAAGGSATCCISCESHSECTEGGQTGCVTTTTWKATESGCGTSESPGHGPEAHDYCDNDHDGTVDEIHILSTEETTNPSARCWGDGFAWGERIITHHQSSVDQWCFEQYGTFAESFVSGDPVISVCQWQGSGWWVPGGWQTEAASVTCATAYHRD